MVSDRPIRVLRATPVRYLPADLAVTLAVTGLTVAAVFTPVVRDTPVRTLFGIVFFLAIPGYAFISAVFPGRYSPARDGVDAGASSRGSGIDGIERIALSLATSVAIVPVHVLAIARSPWQITLESIVFALAGFVCLATAVATVRRLQRPPTERFRVPYHSWFGPDTRAMLEPEGRGDVLLLVLVVVSVVLALGTVGLLAVTPQQSQYAAVYVLTEDDDEFVAGQYPTEIGSSEGVDFVVGVDNEEHDSVEYTIVLVEHPAEEAAAQGHELERFEPTLEAGESWHEPHRVEPTLAGDVRLTWLLYGGEVPAAPSVETADAHASVTLTVTEPEGVA